MPSNSTVAPHAWASRVTPSTRPVRSSPRGGEALLLGRKLELQSLHPEVRTAILAPAVFVRLRAGGVFLAVADDGDPARPDTARDEIGHRRPRTSVTEREVVFGRAARVGVPLDEERVARVGLQRLRIRVEHLGVFRTDLVPIEVEMDVPELRHLHEVLRVGSGEAGVR